MTNRTLQQLDQLPGWRCPGSPVELGRHRRSRPAPTPCPPNSRGICGFAERGLPRHATPRGRPWTAPRPAAPPVPHPRVDPQRREPRRPAAHESANRPPRPMAPELLSGRVCAPRRSSTRSVASWEAIGTGDAGRDRQRPRSSGPLLHWTSEVAGRPDKHSEAHTSPPCMAQLSWPSSLRGSSDLEIVGPLSWKTGSAESGRRRRCFAWRSSRPRRSRACSPSSSIWEASRTAGTVPVRPRERQPAALADRAAGG